MREEIVCTILVIMIFLAFMGFLFWGICNASTTVDIYDYEALLKPCEHEFVMSSKYNWFFRQYQIVSKCIKCGKVI